MSGGGSGGSGTQKYEWNDALSGHWISALNDANAYQHKPYEAYEGSRIADINGDQTSAMDSIRRLTNQGGTPEAMAAGNQLYKTLQGEYLDSDPYAGAQNQYAGMDNPYYRQMTQQGVNDLVQGYQQGVGADTTRMFNMAGAFGGSAHQNAVANNETALGKSLGNYLNQMGNAQYDRSGSMEEARLGRGSNAYQGERGRMMGAVPGAQNTQNMALQGAQARMSIGDILRSFNQDNLNQNYNDWQQEHNYDQSQLDYYTGILSRAQGGMSPNSTTTQSGYAASPYSQLLGAGLAAYGLSR